MISARHHIIQFFRANTHHEIKYLSLGLKLTVFSYSLVSRYGKPLELLGMQNSYRVERLLFRVSDPDP